VRAVLDACHGNQTNAARILGVDRKTLARNLPRWNISPAAQRRDLQPGSLIVIEGIDGAGITTQAMRLVDHLRSRGHRAVLTTEPSEGPVGVLLRELLAAKTRLTHPGAMRTLSLLFAADRVDHFHRVVAPALAKRTTVVSDRWYHSSLAYQRTGVERDWIMTLNRHTRTPDVTVFLEVRPEVGQERRAAAGRTPEYFHELAVQREVVAGYRATIAELRAQGERIESIDGEREVDDVFTAVLRALGIDRRRRA
jgi:dTMP kinase